MTKKEIIAQLTSASITFDKSMKLDELKALLPAPAETPVGSELAMGIIATLVGIQQTTNMFFMKKGDLYVEFSKTTGATTYSSLLKAYRSALKPFAVHVATTKTGIEKFEVQIKMSDTLTVTKPYGAMNDICHTLAVATAKVVQSRNLKFNKEGKATAEMLTKVTKKDGEVTKLKEVRQQTVFKKYDVDFALKFLATFNK